VMYLHLGGSVIVPEGAVVGVFDLDNSSQSHLTRAYLSAAEKTGQVSAAGDDIPKSFVVCESAGKRKVVLSQMSPATLLKRAEDDVI
jgi:hypothetical protein